VLIGDNTRAVLNLCKKIKWWWWW